MRKAKNFLMAMTIYLKMLLHPQKIIPNVDAASAPSGSQKNTKASILSINSSQEWIVSTKKKLGDRLVSFHWIDCGALESWRTPLNFQNRHNFKNYALAARSSDIHPDNFFIDGRFRVYCFLTSLKYAKEGTRIIFDDYTNRPHYHIAEEFLPRSETGGRQCLFLVPPKEKIDSTHLEQMLEKFEYVMA
ncbi:hypothetical protein [Robbsia andropogonis]|uniref:hypothetical protein n=1 Tax=Robbsia andropogonis TaxID=28092 RepID=UPI002A6A9D9C|nr:hypothetical protein [Robbsia andropogonis]